MHWCKQTLRVVVVFNSKGTFKTMNSDLSYSPLFCHFRPSLRLTRVWRSREAGVPGTHCRWSCWRSWCGSWGCFCCREVETWPPGMWLQTPGMWLQSPSGPGTASGSGNACHGPPGDTQPYRGWKRYQCVIKMKDEMEKKLNLLHLTKPTMASCSLSWLITLLWAPARAIT